MNNINIVIADDDPGKILTPESPTTAYSISHATRIYQLNKKKFEYLHQSKYQ